MQMMCVDYIQLPLSICKGSVPRPRMYEVTSWCLVVPRLPLYLASLFISLVFLLVNLTCAVLVKTGTWERKVIVSVRVAINDTLFVLCAVSLSICLYKISKMSLANIYLESKVRNVASSLFCKWLPGLHLKHSRSCSPCGSLNFV